ncbi:MAG: cupin domain-containing protein [Halobacteriota archaeon]
MSHEESPDGNDRETLTEGSLKAGEGNYFFHLDERSGIDAGPEYTTTHGTVVEGERMQMGLMSIPAGTGADLHIHPNEQFTYILQGTLQTQVAGEEATVSEGSLVYVPSDTPHKARATDDEDVVFVVVKDLRHGITGIPVDESSVESTDDEQAEVTAGSRETKTAGAIKAGAGNYLFDLAELSGIDAGPDYSTAHGAVVEGEQIQVGVMNMTAHTGARMHSHPNEQFSYYLQGESHNVIDGQERDVSAGWLRVTPANTEHKAYAISDEDVYFFVAKDLSHSIVGNPVDTSTDEAYYEEGYEPDDE